MKPPIQKEEKLLKINKPFTTENWCLCVRLVLVQSQFFPFFLKGHHLCPGLILHNTKKEGEI